MKTVERSSIEEPEPKDRRPKQGFLGFLGEVPGLILMAFVLALIIRTFLFQAFFIPSPSMEPTLQEGDRVLVNKIPYYFHDPRRGDIIVFENPNPEAARRTAASSAGSSTGCSRGSGSSSRRTRTSSSA